VLNPELAQEREPEKWYGVAEEDLKQLKEFEVKWITVNGLIMGSLNVSENSGCWCVFFDSVCYALAQPGTLNSVYHTIPYHTIPYPAQLVWKSVIKGLLLLLCQDLVLATQ